MIGRVLNDRYEIIELIGRGGMAFVYKARDLKLNRFVAVKVLKEEYSGNEQFIRKFERESQSAAKLTHPNIVSVYDVGLDDGVHFIVMELVDGITLKQYLNKMGVLDYEEATRFVIDIAEALACAHSNGIIHRDIKPQNILLTPDLNPKVTDFGIARAVTSSTVTMTKETMGSVHYISPEQARGGFLNERSDLYSLGILFYELVTGELPFDEDTTITIAIKHIREEITPPIEINPHIPESVNDVILKLTQKNPDDRYQNADELIDDLDGIMEDPNMQVAATREQKAAKGSIPKISESGLFQVQSTVEPNPLADDDDDDLLQEMPEKTKKNKKPLIIGIIVGVLVVILGIIAVIVLSGDKDVTVPDLSGMTKDQATTALSAVNLTLEVEKEVYSSTIEAGKIVSQNPTANSTYTEGKTVKVYISKGAESVTVPNVLGKSENEAIALIENANLIVGEIKREYNSDYSSGTVFKTSPESNEKVTTQTRVTIYVSQGTETKTVPYLVGLDQNSAIKMIQSSGFTVGETKTNESSTEKAGTVTQQTPAGGTEAEEGTAVDIWVSAGSNTGGNTGGTEQPEEGETGTQ